MEVFPQAPSIARLASCPSDVSQTTLTIGNLALHGRAILAPMAGITDAGMRRIARREGATYTVSEMVPAAGLARGEAESRLRAEADGVGPHVVQIAGCRAADLAEGARIAEACGADVIDINMGCPAKKVTGGLAGSALMRDLDHATALIAATCASVDGPVTVKMRLGWDEASLNAPELARRAEGEGVSLVTVHGRTRNQFYQGRADWSAVRAVAAAVRIPVVVNGDCQSAEDARNMLKLSGAAAVMIGRAALGRPWILGHIAHALNTGASRPPPSLAEQHAWMLEHHDALLRAFGIAKGIRHARKHLAAFAALLPAGAGTAEVTQRLVTSENPSAVAEALRELVTTAQQREDEVHVCAA